MAAYRVTGRGGKGVVNLKVTEKTGPVTGVARVEDEDEIMVTTAKGMFLRARVRDVRLTGRNAQGVSLIRLEEGDHVMAVARLAKEDA
jgi:DNA gyrase subunit A